MYALRMLMVTLLTPLRRHRLPRTHAVATA